MGRHLSQAQARLLSGNDRLLFVTRVRSIRQFVRSGRIQVFSGHAHWGHRPLFAKEGYGGEAIFRLFGARCARPNRDCLLLPLHTFPRRPSQIGGSKASSVRCQRVLRVRGVRFQKGVSSALLCVPSAFPQAAFAVGGVGHVNVQLQVVNVGRARRDQFTDPIQARRHPFLPISRFPVRVFRGHAIAVLSQGVFRPRDGRVDKEFFLFPSQG